MDRAINKQDGELFISTGLKELGSIFEMVTISPTQMERYRETARWRRIEAEHHRRQRLKRARNVARDAAVLLHQQFKATQVAFFGSLAHPERFHLRSDVDLAVWGVDDKSFLRALAAVSSLDNDIEVDLIAVEQAPAALLAAIEKEGIPI